MLEAEPPAFARIPRRLPYILVVFTIVLSSCGSRTTPPAETQPPTAEITVINTKPAATVDAAASALKEGFRYSDASGDMAVDLLDVIDFQASVDEEAETLEVVLRMRDVPPTALLGQTTEFVEYTWAVFIFLNPAKSSSSDIPGDYYFAINTTTHDPSESATSIVPVEQLLENKGIYNAFGVSNLSLDAVFDTEMDTLTLKGNVPGITSSAVFSFATAYYDNTIDRPDNYTHPSSTGISTPPTNDNPSVASTPKPTRDAFQLVAAGDVRAYPGPEHYEGDILSFEIQAFNGIPEAEQQTTLNLDNGEPFEVTGKWSYYNTLVLPLALDTAGLTGNHVLHISTGDGIIDTSYVFEILPTDRRPANETGAVWMTSETKCCTFHYVSGTAAARDIDFIAEHFQNAAEDFSRTTGEQVVSEMDVYLMDRMLGNGGFGGNGQLIVSYTDRYYGPTVGADGLETLARHELTHAADFGLAQSGDGIDFNYEGMAVYVAGGHYKPEPLAERGAAMFDLGYYTPVGEYIDQHELAYLYPAAMLAYIAETYGPDVVWKFLTADNDVTDGQPGPLNIAIQRTFGISMEEFDQNFRTWLEDHEPDNQLDDLRLTIELQDLRRQYQNMYTPLPTIIFDMLEERSITHPEYLPITTREAASPANVAFELMTANAQKAIVVGNYPNADNLIHILENILGTGKFEDPLAMEYLEITKLLLEQGYDIDELTLQADKAEVSVMVNGFEQQILRLQKGPNGWDVSP